MTYIFYQIASVVYSRLKVCADNEKKMLLRNQNLFLEWLENIVGEGKNVGYQQFLLFLKHFYKTFLQSIRVGIVC